MRILVTGCNGLFGSAMVRRLRETRPGDELLGVDLTAPVAIAGEACDLTDPDATAAAVAGLAPELVFHFAGRVAGTDADAVASALVATTRSVLAALAAHAPTAVFVLPGSAAEYGTLPAGRAAFSEDDAPAPVSNYGRAKAAQTAVALGAADDGLDVRVGRVFNLIGPGVSPAFLIGSVASQLAAIAAGDAEPRLSLGPLSSVRDFVDVRDACDGLLAIAERGVAGRVYNVCSGVGRTSRNAVEAMVGCSGLDVEIVEASSGSPRTGLDASVGDPDRISAECGWLPRIAFEDSACDAVSSALVR